MILHKLMHNPVMAFLRKPCNADVAKLALRVALAAVFMRHGWMKLTGLEGTGMFFGKLGIPMPEVMAVVVAVTEFFGGLSILLGLAVRFWSVGLMIDMIVAILTALDVGSFKTYEFEFSLLMMSLSLALSGAGAYGLDALLMKRGAGEHAAAMPVPAPKA